MCSMTRLVALLLSVLICFAGLQTPPNCALDSGVDEANVGGVNFGNRDEKESFAMDMLVVRTLQLASVENVRLCARQSCSCATIPTRPAAPPEQNNTRVNNE